MYPLLFYAILKIQTVNLGTFLLHIYSMKLLNISILILLLSSCVFSGKPDKIALQDKATVNTIEKTEGIFIRDSIKVNMEIGDFKVFYKISEYEHPKNHPSVSDENKITNKTILINVQKIDTTSIVPYKIVDINDFAQILKEDNIEELFIDHFCLKEVNKDSLVFNAKLCMFEGNLCKSVDLMIKENGDIIYSYTVSG